MGRQRQRKWIKRMMAAAFSVMIASGGWPAAGMAAEEQNGSEAAAPAANSGGAVFADVAKGHWAEKHITKLSLQGVIKGYQGKFNPSSEVTHQDAVIMAIRLMGLENKIDQNGKHDFPEGFQVREGAKPYIALAIDVKLLEQDEEWNEAGNASSGWGDTPASREWVTKLLIRALGQQSEALQFMTEATPFKDDAQIDPQYRGYVHLAVELGLIKGITADQFSPKGKINRASIATMFSRSQPLMLVSYENQYGGIVTDLTDRSIKLYTDDGKVQDFNLEPATPYYTYASEKAIEFNELKRYIRVIVIERQGEAAYVEITDDTLQIDPTEAELVRLYPEEQTMTLLVNDKYKDFHYDPAATIYDANGNGISLQSLIAGSRLTVWTDSFRESPRIVQIDVKYAPVNKQGSGVLQQIDTAAGTVTILDKGDNQAETYRLSDAVTIHDNDRYIVKPGDLEAGSAITYEVKNGYVVSIILAVSPARTVNGQLNSIDSAKKTLLYVKDGGKLEANYITDSTEVVIEGLSSASPNDLEPGDRITLTIGSDDRVNKIVVTNRKVETYRRATIVLYEPESKLLAVKDDHGNPGAYYVTSRTKIDMNGTAMTSDMLPTFLIKNKKITFTYTGTQIVSLQLSNYVDGTVTSFNPANQTIQLLREDGASETLYLGGVTVEQFGKSIGTINDLPIGASVRAMLDDTLNRVVKFQLKTTVQVEILSKDSANRKLSVKDENESFHELVLSASIPIIDGQNTAVQFSQIANGDRWNISFVGSSAVSMQRVHVMRGAVLAADSASNSITVRDMTGQIQTISVKEGYRVVRNGTAGTNLTQLMVNERVEVSQDSSGKDVIIVLAGIDKSFWKYDAAANEIHVKRSSLTDQNFRYTLASNAYIHRKGNVLSLAALQDGDAITLYIAGGKVIEVEAR